MIPKVLSDRAKVGTISSESRLRFFPLYNVIVSFHKSQIMKEFPGVGSKPWKTSGTSDRVLRQKKS